MNESKLPELVYRLRQDDFGAIPGSPWVYWISNTIRNIFRDTENIEKHARPRQGTATSDNNRFLRFWWEINEYPLFSKNPWKWFPYMKGGAFKKWYGNQFHTVNWCENAKEIRNFDRSVIRNKDYYFREGITWSDLSSKGFGVRYLPPGFIFDVKGSSGFPEKDHLFTIMAVMNSSWMNYALGLLNPTVSFQVGDIARVPFNPPTPSQKSVFDAQVPQCIHIQQVGSLHSETTFDFIVPFNWPDGVLQSQGLEHHLSALETQINDQVYKLYDISSEDHQAIDNELGGGQAGSDDAEDIKVEDEEDNAAVINSVALAYSWLSYSVGNILGRFQPGTPGALGSAIHRSSDFSIGSLPEPTEEEFNELVGDPSQFAYIDEQDGRHVFSKETEQALQAMALPDGIAVFDPSHPRDLPTLVSKALELMLGQAQAQEVIQQAAGGDLRKFLEKDFFTQHHIKQYRKRPVYWPIQSSKRSYGFVLFHEKIDRNTFYALQQEPYLPTKRRAVQLRLEELSKKVLTAQGAARKPIEKEMDDLRQLAEELAQFAKDLDAITSGGYEPEADWIDDGVILRMAPLWSVIPIWKSEPKKYWDALAAGKYDWSHIAMKYWPDRVKQACKKNKSYAIAHGHEEWYQGNG